MATCWSDMYIDLSTNQPAFAFCAPLTNLTTKVDIDGKLVTYPRTDGPGLIGVACSGMYIEDIGENLAETFTALNFSDKGVYIREASTGKLVASSAHRSAYYDITSMDRISATESPDVLIRWSAGVLLDAGSNASSSWPADGTTVVAWASTPMASGSGLSSVDKGEAFYISTKDFTENGLHWNVVAVQKVTCLEGYTVDTEAFTCRECVYPAYSPGGSSLCDTCVSGYFLSAPGGTCIPCPDGTSCEVAGKSTLANLEILEDYWRLGDGTDVVYECPYPDACKGGANFSRRDDTSYCEYGYHGILCSTCLEGTHYFDSNNKKCEQCVGGNVLAQLFTMLGISPVFLVFASLALGGCFWILWVNFFTGTLPESGRMGLLFLPFRWIISIRKRHWKEVKLKLQVLTSYTQIASSIGTSCHIVFPASAEKLLNNAGEAFNLDFISGLGLRCWPAEWAQKMDYMTSLLYATGGPLITALILATVFWVQYGLYEKKKKINLSKNKVANKTPTRRHGFAGMLFSANAMVPAELLREFTKREIDALRKTFETFDKNGNGNLEKKEVGFVLAEYGDFESDKDTDDESIDEIEKAAASPDEAAEVATKMTRAEKIQSELDAIWQHDDISGQGHINFSQFLFVVYYDRLKGPRSSSLVGRQQGDDNNDSNDPGRHLTRIVDKVEAKVAQHKGHLIFYLFLVLTFLVLPGVSTKLFNLFKCRSFESENGNGTERYLYADYTINCDSARYNAFVIYAYVMIAVYPVRVLVLCGKRWNICNFTRF